MTAPVGYFVYTPLVQERGETVLVNRGFVPFDLKDPASRPEGPDERRGHYHGTCA